MSLNNMSVNDHLLEECAGEEQPGIRRIMELVAERDRLQGDLMRALARAIKTESENITLRTQIEDLHAEALAWHGKAEEQGNQVTVTLSLDALRQLWSVARGNNPYRNQED